MAQNVGGELETLLTKLNKSHGNRQIGNSVERLYPRLDGSGTVHHVILTGIEKSVVGGLMTGQIDKILWHGV